MLAIEFDATELWMISRMPRGRISPSRSTRRYARIAGYSDDAEVAAALERSLDSVLKAWQASWDAELERVARTMIEDISTLALRPSALALAGMIDLRTGTADSTAGDRVRLRDWLSLAPHLRGMGTTAVELRLRRSIVEAQRQIARLDAAAGAGNAAVRAGFSSVAEAERTRHYVTTVERGGMLLQAMGELAEIATILGGPREEKRRRAALQRDREMRDSARSQALQIIDIFLTQAARRPQPHPRRRSTRSRQQPAASPTAAPIP
jgi:hypothetical protein